MFAQLKRCKAVKEFAAYSRRREGAINKAIEGNPYHTFERCTEKLQAVPSSWVPQPVAIPAAAAASLLEPSEPVAVQPQDLCNPIDTTTIDTTTAEFISDPALITKLSTQMVWAAGATVASASSVEVWAGQPARTCAQYAGFLGYTHDYGAIRHAREK